MINFDRLLFKILIKMLMVILLVGDLKHLVAGFPSNPIGHVQIGLCIFAWHLADSAHALVNSHGS